MTDVCRRQTSQTGRTELDNLTLLCLVWFSFIQMRDFYLDERHDALLSAAIWAMRTYIQPGTAHAPPRAFKLLAPSPGEPGSSRA